MTSLTKLIRYWFGGIRIYIGIAAVLISLAVWWWSSAVYGDTQLRIIRIQEVYGWISIGLIFLALLIGPALRLFKKLPGKPIIGESRRALGISAAWFAALHAVVVYAIQLQATNPLQLPDRYRLPLLIGLIALFGLLVMTATSVNAVMKRWGIWWFRLHRIVYGIVLLGMLHAFLIGAHGVTTTALIALTAAATIWLIATLAVMIRSDRHSISGVVGLCVGLIALVSVISFGYVQGRTQTNASSAAGAGHGH